MPGKGKHHLVDAFMDAIETECKACGGDEGGRIIFEGIPEQLLQTSRAVTRPYLEKALGK